MRVVSLSDHPSAMLRQAQQQRAAEDREIRQAQQRRAAEDREIRQAQQRRAAEDREIRQAQEAVLTVHHERVTRARATRDQAWAQRRWGAWLRGVFAVWRARRQIPATRLPMSQPTDEEEKLAAGVAGERLVADHLGRALGDKWTLLRGYRNRRGEIDLLLLGPRGLFAMEVKNQNATIDCAGDRWQATKYDKYGNLVGGRAEMTDARGRSPSEQLNEPASELEGFLGRFGHPVAISRIVVLTHPRARLRSCTRPTVHVFTSVRQITGLLNGSPVAITTAECAELERLIIRDHHFYEKPRSS